MIARFRPIVVPLLMVLAMGSAHGAPPSPTADASVFNRELRLRLLVDPQRDPAEAIRERISEGQNIQMIATLPGARLPNGRLLDPNSVRVMWNEKPLPTYVYYKEPSTALVFALTDFISGPGELSATASLLDSGTIDSGWRLPIPVKSADQGTTDTTARGRAISVRWAEDDSPTSGSFVFGQRRSDLLTISDDRGLAWLDAPTRNTAGNHYAWRTDSWTTAFDPISSPTVSLYRRHPAAERPVTVHAHDAAGRSIDRGLVVVDHVRYVPLRHGLAEVMVRGEGETFVLVIAAGYEPAFTTVRDDEAEAAIQLIPNQPPAEQPQ